MGPFSFASGPSLFCFALFTILACVTVPKLMGPSENWWGKSENVSQSKPLLLPDIYLRYCTVTESWLTQSQSIRRYGSSISSPLVSSRLLSSPLPSPPLPSPLVVLYLFFDNNQSFGFNEASTTCRIYDFVMLTCRVYPRLKGLSVRLPQE